jgi:small subunit ribosomal protein S6
MAQPIERLSAPRRRARAVPGQSHGRGTYLLMKRAYELTFIVRLDGTDETTINNTVDQVRAWVEAEELGQVTKIDRMGRRKMAYEIDKQRDGFYVMFNANIEPKALLEIERNLNLSPYVLRYLFVRIDE